MKVDNPIVNYLRELLSSGKITKEKICVACDLKYPTFENTFDRPTVSPLVKKCLQFAGIVPARVIQDYDVWLTNYKPRKEKKNDPKVAARIKNKSKLKDDGNEEASY